MRALRVTINDRKTIVAGAEDLSVLSAIVTLTGKLGRRAVDPGRRKRTRNEHLRWTPHVKLKVGDRVLVELIRTARSGKVVSRSSARPHDERSYYEHLKSEYLKLKAKYEP